MEFSEHDLELRVGVGAHEAEGMLAGGAARDAALELWALDTGTYLFAPLDDSCSRRPQQVEEATGRPRRERVSL